LVIPKKCIYSYYLIYNQIRAIITITNMFSMYFNDSVINLIILLVLLNIKWFNNIRLVLIIKFKQKLNLADNNKKQNILFYFLGYNNERKIVLFLPIKI